MRTPVEELLRRLIMLGLPLTIGCSSSSLGGPNVPPTGCQSTHTFDQVLVVSRPAQNPDGGFGPTIEDWDACAQTMNCLPLCGEITQFGFQPQITGCTVVGDAGADGAAGDPDAAAEPALDIHLTYTYIDCTGRRPAGFLPRRRCARGSKVGRWFADASVLEAASVPAFRRLVAELRAHGAPAPLLRAARRAIADEVRHHRLTAAIARENGAAAAPRHIRPAAVRGLYAMAAENAREGCVRETFGAATAAFQARHAADPRLRAVMASIARDEARHALLAWEIDAWARAVQPSSARRLTAERDAAARTLEAEIASTSPPATLSDRSLARALGLPPPPVLRRLVADARGLLWNAVG